MLAQDDASNEFHEQLIHEYTETKEPSQHAINIQNNIEIWPSVLSRSSLNNHGMNKL